MIDGVRVLLQLMLRLTPVSFLFSADNRVCSALDLKLLPLFFVLKWTETARPSQHWNHLHGRRTGESRRRGRWTAEKRRSANRDVLPYLARILHAPLQANRCHFTHHLPARLCCLQSRILEYLFKSGRVGSQIISNPILWQHSKNNQNKFDNLHKQLINNYNLSTSHRVYFKNIIIYTIPFPSLQFSISITMFI